MNNSALLRTDEHGAILIGDTRITLDVIIAAIQNGDSPEQIIEGFPSLQLGDIYAVIAYYIDNRDEVDAYLRRRDEEAERIHREIEAKRPDMFRLQKQLRERTKPE
jgi:uncharacterized protein (DUF433 family)